MKRNSRRAGISVLLLFVFLLAACSGSSAADENKVNSEATDAPSAAATATDAPTAAAMQTTPERAAQNETSTQEPALPLTDDGEQIVARVNGEPITLSEFQRAVDRNQIAAGDIASYDAAAEMELQKLIEQTVINQAAAEMGITVSDEAVQAEYEAMREIMPDDSEWQNWLMENRFISEREFREASREALLTQRLQQRVIEDADVTVPQVRARHILVETEAEAQQVVQRLNAGEDFVALASEVSIDTTTADSGGALGINGGWFVRDDLVVPSLFDKAMELEPGDYSQPIETALGYHIVQTLEKGQRTANDEERARYGSEQFNAWLQEQVEQADIESYVNY